MNFEKDLNRALKDYEKSLVEHYEKLPDPERRRAMKGRKLYYVFGGLAAALVLLVLVSSYFGSGMLMGKSSFNQAAMDGGYREEMGYAATPEEAVSADMDEEAETGFGAEDLALEKEKIIRTYNLEIETKDIAKTLKDIEALVKAMGGYIENSHYSGKLEVGENAYAYYALRIPRGRVDEVRDSLEEMGQILSFAQYSDNVTRAYRDTESRIELLKLKEDKLKELLDKAENLEDLILLESQIMDLQFEREQITGYLRDLDDRIDFDTYYVDIRQVKTYTEKSFSQKFKDSFSLGFTNFTDFLEDFVLFFAYNWAFLLLLLGLVVGSVFGIRRRRKKKVKED